MSTATPKEEKLLEVYHTGELTVVGFAGRRILDRVRFDVYRDQLSELVRRHDARVLAIDLAGLEMVPSAMIGVLVSLSKLVPRIEIHNASDGVRNVFSVMKLDQKFHVQPAQPD